MQASGWCEIVPLLMLCGVEEDEDEDEEDEVRRNIGVLRLGAKVRCYD